MTLNYGSRNKKEKMGATYTVEVSTKSSSKHSDKQTLKISHSNRCGESDRQLLPSKLLAKTFG